MDMLSSKLMHVTDAHTELHRRDGLVGLEPAQSRHSKLSSWILVPLTAFALLAGGCAPSSFSQTAPAAAVARRSASVSHVIPVANRALQSEPGTITAAVLAVPADSTARKRRVVWVLGLHGHMTTRSLYPCADRGLALSPSGRVILYVTGPQRSRTAPIPPTRLRALNLVTGRNYPVLTGGRVLAFGWDSSGQVVAVTCPPLAPPLAKNLTVWHGDPGRLEPSPVDAFGPVDIAGLVASDGNTALFANTPRVRNTELPPSASEFWRYDFTTHRLELALRLDEGVNRPESPIRSLFPQAYVGGPPYSWSSPDLNLPFSATSVATNTVGTYVIDLLRYSDLGLIQSMELPPPGSRYFDAAPVFDSTFTRYAARVNDLRKPISPLPAWIMEVDLATRQGTVLSWPSSSIAHPLGYLGTSETLLFVGRDRTGVAILMKRPDNPPRVLFRLHPPYTNQVTWPGLLGVQYAR